MPKRLLGAALAALAVAYAAPLAAQGSGSVDLAERFGARPTVLDISLSPSGDRIAFLSPGGDLEEVLYVIDLEQGGQPRPIAVDSNPNGQLTYCDWASEEYLVCNFFGTSDIGEAVVSFNRIMIVNADGSGVRIMDAGGDHRSLGYGQYGGTILSLDVEGEPNSVLVQRYVAPRFQTGSLVRSRSDGLSVERIDLDTLGSSDVIRARSGSVGYLTDETGTVRIMGTMSRGGGGYVRNDDIEWSYVPAGRSGFESLAPDRDLEDMWVAGVDAALDVAYVLGEEGDYRSLYRMPMDGSGRSTLLLPGDGYDIDGVLRIGRRGRIIGATYATDRRHFTYFDQEMLGLSNELGLALPGQPLIQFAGADRDERMLLVLASSDTNPGMYYLLDSSTYQMSEVLPVRTELEGITLSQVQSVSFPARDGTQIPAYLTLPPGSNGRGLPAIVMPHGGPEARDEWGFDWLAQFFAQSGYAVLQPNFRGSTGYGSAWQMENGFQSWRTAIGDILDGGRWLVSEGIAESGQVAVAGWSYGGYAALQAEASEPDVFGAVLAIAPVTDLGRLRDDARNYSNFPIVSDFIGRGEHIESGSPTRNAERFNSPVLLVHGLHDQTVPYQHSRLMRDALEDDGRPVELLEFADLDHSLADSSARTTLLREAAEFLTMSMTNAGSTSE